MAKRQINDRARQLMREGGKRGGLKNITDGTIVMHSNPEMIIKKSDAIALGFTVYRTGKLCINGHRSWRRTYSSACIQCKQEGLA